jgi:hypothetical protein
MKLNDAFPSRWLKSEDCEDGDLILTIKSAAIEPVKGTNGDEDKLILRFAEEDKGLILNKTNAKSISKIHGDDTDDWVGKKVALYSTEVEFGGETMLGIRVRLKAPKAGVASPASRASSAPGPVPLKPKAGNLAASIASEDDEDDDSSIPF